MAVIGAGVVGTAIARQLARYRLSHRGAGAGQRCGQRDVEGQHGHPAHRVRHRARHASNPDWSAGATGCWPSTPQVSGIALERTGALLVAWDEEQAGRLDGVVAKAHANGYLPAHRIDAAELYRREPGLGPGATGAVVGARRVDRLSVDVPAWPSPPRPSPPASCSVWAPRSAGWSVTPVGGP